jgi:hypothetical protein
MKTESTDQSRLPQPLFPLGHLVATPGALAALADRGIPPVDLVHRHVTGDWGELDEHDVQSNWLAIREGSRVLSSYVLSETTKVWIITEAGDRSSTTILLPEEY